MKKTFVLNEIDCPVCAGKLEDKIKKISGIDSANINYMLGQLVVEYSDDLDDKITTEILKTIKRFDSDIDVEIL